MKHCRQDGPGEKHVDTVDLHFADITRYCTACAGGEWMDRGPGRVGPGCAPVCVAFAAGLRSPFLRRLPASAAAGACHAQALSALFA